MVDAAQSLGDGGGVGHHADGALDAGQVAAGDDGGRLVVDAALAGGTLVDELDGPLGLDGGDGGGNKIFSYHMALIFFIYNIMNHCLNIFSSTLHNRVFLNFLPWVLVEFNLSSAVLQFFIGVYNHFQFSSGPAYLSYLPMCVFVDSLT